MLASSRRPKRVRRHSLSLRLEGTNEGRQRVLGIAREVALIEDSSVADHLLLRYWIPEQPTFILCRVPNEHALLVVWSERRPLVLLYVYIGQAAEDAQVTHIWLTSKPRFKGRHVIDSTR